MTNASLDGLLTGLSLIVAIGAQNAFLLRQGLRQVRVGAVVAICTLSDLVLIVAGVRWIGVAFLTWYGLSSVSRASVSRARGRSALTAARDDSRSERAVVRRAFA